MPPAASLSPPPAPRPISTPPPPAPPPTRTAGPSLPSPDYIAENPLYGVQTTALSQGYSPLGVDGSPLGALGNFSRSQALSDGGFQRDYLNPAGSATGISQKPQGGGSLSVVSGIDPAQRQATDFNVRNLESQIQALRSLREARNPSVTQPSADSGIDLQGLQRQANPFYQPGQGFGDEVLDRDRFMRKFPDSRSGRAMRQQAEMGLAQLGNQRLNNLLDNALGQQQSRQDGQTALAQVWQKALADQQDYGLRLQDLGLNRAKFGLDARKAQDEAERTGVRDQYLNNLSATQAHKATLENAGLEQKGSLFNVLRHAPNEEARQRALADLLAWHGRQADQPLGY